MKVICLPEDETMCTRLLPIAEHAADKLELDRYLQSIMLCIDDFGADERIWFSLQPVPPRDSGVWNLSLYLSPEQIMREQPARPWFPPAVWDQQDAPTTKGPTDDTVFSERRAITFVNHQFLLIRDICDETLTPDDIPHGLVEAFQTTWALTVDCRLRAQGLLCIPMAVRRRMFTRQFSAAGVLLPEHWQIYHVLAEDDSLSQDDVMQLTRRLPRLRGRSSGGRD